MADTQNARDEARVEPVWDQGGPPGDETPPSGTSGGFRGIDRSDWTMFGAIAAVSIVIAVVNGLSAAQDAAWHGGSYDPARRLFWEFSSILVILLTMPILVMAVRHMRRTSGIARRAGIAAIALIAFSAVHISGMVAIRKLVLWLLGSQYDFRLSFATLLYEFRKDTVAFLLLTSTVWLIQSRRELLRERRRETAAAMPPPPEPAGPDSIWLRDGPSRVRVAPRQILWVASAGNYIEYSLADGTQHLIRGTLASAESGLARFRIVRVHRTRLANLDRVTSVDFNPSGDFELTFDNGRTLQGSRRFRPVVAALGDRATPA
jgi:DNA-binding LytR/AlgR family response regulator